MKRIFSLGLTLLVLMSLLIGCAPAAPAETEAAPAEEAPEAAASEEARIPINPRVESLNVSASAGITLYNRSKFNQGKSSSVYLISIGYESSILRPRYCADRDDF